MEVRRDSTLAIYRLQENLLSQDGSFYNGLIEFGTPMKLVGLNKVCLNETHSKVRISKHLPDASAVQNV
jgi:hypothetical protein